MRSVVKSGRFMRQGDEFFRNEKLICAQKQYIQLIHQNVFRLADVKPYLYYPDVFYSYYQFGLIYEVYFDL